MPNDLRRITGFGGLHFITFCCYHRRAFLGTAQARNAAIRVLDETRAKYGFALVGYVFMPEHVHLLLSESGGALPAEAVQIFKQRVSRRLRERKPVSKSCLLLEAKRTIGGFGRGATTISMYIRGRRCRRSCTTCMRIRCAQNW